MKSNKCIIFCAALALAATTANAQDNSSSEFGTWTGASVTKKINRQWSIEAGAELRTQNNMKKIDRWSGSLGVDYKPFDFLKFGASYNFLYTYNMEEWKAKYDDDDGELNGYNVTNALWIPKHRVSFDITGEVPVNRFTISLRERVQYTYNDSKETTKRKMRFYGTTDSLYQKGSSYADTAKVKHKLVLRSRLQVEYNIRHCPFTPYVSVELYNDMKDGLSLQKTRWSVGGEYKFNKHNSLDIGYYYCNSNDDDEPKGHILSLSYAYKF